MKLDYEVNISTAKILRKYGLGEDKAAQRFLAEDVERKCQPYVPMSAGSAAHMVNAARVTADSIIYPGPYAHYQYVGQVYGPNYPIKDGGFVTGWYSPPRKTPTGRSLNHSHFRHPLATSKWDKAMETARKGDLAQAVENYIKR